MLWWMSDPNVDILWPNNATANLVARRSIKSGTNSCKVLSHVTLTPHQQVPSSVRFAISEALVWFLYRWRTAHNLHRCKHGSRGEEEFSGGTLRFHLQLCSLHRGRLKDYYLLRVRQFLVDSLECTLACGAVARLKSCLYKGLNLRRRLDELFCQIHTLYLLRNQILVNNNTA